MDIARIRSEGDFEVVVLHEAHGSLATLVGPHLYKIEGTPPDQKIVFNGRPDFDLFLTRLHDFIAEDSPVTSVPGADQAFSVLKALRYFCGRHPTEAIESGLDDALGTFEEWLTRSAVVGFWCPHIETEIAFPLPNERLIWFAANCAKNNLTRLPAIFDTLYALCIAAENEIKPQDMVAVFEGMDGEVRSRMQYHATFLLEMLGRLFQAVNAVVNARYRANPTPDVSKLTLPEGLTSDAFKYLYGSLLIFKNYDKERIVKYTPTAAKHLRTRY